MLEWFSERARQVVVLAQEEARELGHDYIGTEHLLIAVLREEVGVALSALSPFGVRPASDRMLAPTEMQLLVYLALAARPDTGGSPREDIDPLSLALVTDQHDVERAVASLLRHGLVVGPEGVDDDRLAITPAGVARVEQWLGLTASLFGSWPPTVPGVDDA
jgi:Clp amino terminal domain, pathogenicity island component